MTHDKSTTSGRAIETAGSIDEYARIHYAARKNLRETCDRCGSSSDIQAALRPDVERSSLKQEPVTHCLYSIQLEDYVSLCMPCHRRLDLVELRPTCRYGHAYTPENTSIKVDGSRRCLTCHREQARLRLSDPRKRAERRAQQRVNRKPLTMQQKARKHELQQQRRLKRHALRLLLAAWLADGTHGTRQETETFRGLLADPGWQPSSAVIEELAPSFRPWAEARGITETVRLALGEPSHAQ